MNSLENLRINELILLVRDRSDKAFEELIKRYTPMINKVISGFSGSSLGYDELFSEGCIALHRAALFYNLERVDVTFGLYAKICVYHKLCDAVAKEDRADIVTDVDINSVPSGGNIEALIEMRERLAEYHKVARSLLSDYEYSVFLAVVNGESNRDIAKRLGRSVKSIENAKARVQKRLRESDAFGKI